MRSPTLLLIRMNAAETSASSAIADWTPLTVVSRSPTTAEIETFISDVSTTSTNIAAASSRANRELCALCSGTRVLASSLIGPPATASERAPVLLLLPSPGPAPPRVTHRGWAGSEAATRRVVPAAATSPVCLLGAVDDVDGGRSAPVGHPHRVTRRRGRAGVLDRRSL